MSDYDDVAAWCERPRGKTAEVCWPSSVAYFPQAAVGFGAELARAAVNAALADRG